MSPREGIITTARIVGQRKAQRCTSTYQRHRHVSTPGAGDTTYASRALSLYYAVRGAVFSAAQPMDILILSETSLTLMGTRVSLER